MSRRSRYILIAFGFLVFLLLAPLTVLYVRGINYDYTTGQFYRTGILAVRSEPNDVFVSLDGTVVRETSGNIKFLKPGSYDVTLSAENFQNWSKRLTVWADQVTWASPAPNKIFLYYNKPMVTNLVSSVVDFTVSGNSVLALQDKNIIQFPLSHPEEVQETVLPAAVNRITEAPGSRYYLLDNASVGKNRFMFDARERKIYDISSLFPGSVKLFFSDSAQLYSIENSQLYEINWRDKTKKLLFTDIRAASILGNTAYVVQRNSLDVVELTSNRQQTLVANLPQFATADILINNQKQILLVLDSTLYHVNSGLQKITGNISEYYFDPQAQSLAIAHAGEVSLYNFDRGALEFITRSAQKLQNARINGYTSYAFFFKDQQLTAAELDTRDHQNQYNLYTATDPEKFYVDEEAKSLVVQDGGDLRLVKIRK